ncbi:MAG: MFS transporter [Azospirillaceae bacterium]
MSGRSLALTVSGFALIATCYGLARFAFGLFLPAISVDLALSPSFGGVISGGSFLGYCLAIIVSAGMTERFGPRFVAGLAGCVATLGMVGIALAPGGVALGAAVLFAGTSTGLASPPLAAAVARRVAPERRDTVNTIVNAGASGGVALSAPAALALGNDWRLAFTIFAGIALLETVAVLLTTPGPGNAPARGARGLPAMSGDLWRLVIAALFMGAASTAVWSFGGELARRGLGWTSADVGTLWLTIGLVGLSGSLAGPLIRRFGLNPVHAGSLVLLAVGALTVGMAANGPAVLVGGGVFGAAYMMLTGVYLVWGVRALPDRPATGLMLGFLAIAVGQVIGAPLFGMLLDSVGARPAAAVFAMAAIAGCVVFRREFPLARPA